jgi:hypothetical protein
MYKTILFVCLSLASSGLHGQQSASSASASSSATSSTNELHEQAQALVVATNARQKMLDGSDNAVEQGRQMLLRTYPNYDPRYADEWAKRMRARTNVDDCLNVIIHVYETNLQVSEMKELIQAQRDAQQSKPSSLSEPLKTKLAGDLGVTLQSQVIGGCSQISARLGGQIGLEIQKEHPEWFNAPKPSTK